MRAKRRNNSISRLRSGKQPSKERRLLTALLLTAAALCLHLLSLFLGTWYFTLYRFVSYFSEPEIFLLNLIPVLLLVAFFYFLTNRAWLGFLIPGLLLVIIGIVNYYMIALRGEPFVAEDIFSAGAGLGILKEYELTVPIFLILAVAAVIGGTVVLAIFAKGRFPKNRWWLRLALLVLTAVLAGVSWQQLYRDSDRYDGLLLSNADRFNVWKDAENYASKGLVYSFLHSVDTMLPTPPEGYSEEAARAILAEYPDADIPREKQVNLIITMLESYSDLSELESISFTADPYAEFLALQKESYCGVLYPDTLGGGTINAERAFLTGFSYPQPRYTRDTESYVRYFSAQGYATDGGHPGYEWFYGRSSVNAHLGFDEYHFYEDTYHALTTPENAYLEEYLNDSGFFAERFAAFGQRDASRPYFSFSVTYQGHSPYADDALNGTEYVSHEGISDEAYYTVNNYLNVIADTGKQAAAYVDRFREIEEPVVLVFFGDHKVTFGAGNSYYEEMGVCTQVYTSEGFRNLYTTPYLIWANDAAKQALGKSFAGSGRDISPCYLMAEIFDCCGWEGPSWLQYQRSVREELPLLQSKNIYKTATGYNARLSQEQSDALAERKIVEYYIREQVPNSQVFDHR